MGPMMEWNKSIFVTCLTVWIALLTAKVFCKNYTVLSGFQAFAYTMLTDREFALMPGCWVSWLRIQAA
jgi:hypothetical protein